MPPPPSDDEDRTDELHQALIHRQQPFALRELQPSSRALSGYELEDQIPRWETHRPTDFPADDLQTVRLSPHHTHLPELAAASVVEYDELNLTVEWRGLGAR